MKRDLLSACRNGVILCDGATGTQLMARGLAPGECGMRWNAERAAKSVSSVPVAVTYAFQKSGDVFRTMMGTTAAEAVARALEAGADIVGANCGTDLSLDDYILLAHSLVAAAGDAPVILQPNAGTPKSGPDGIYYDATADEMGATAIRLRDAGVRIIGGCCGTSPALLAAMGKALG